MAIAGTDWESNFRERMEKMRTAAGMTQTDLARVLREQYGLPFHQATIQRIEAGERPVRLNEAHLIAQAFKTDLETMTASSGSSVVVVSNLIAAAKAFMVAAEGTGRFLREKASGMEWHIRELRDAWEAYAYEQHRAGLEVDHGLAELVNRWEGAYRDALSAIEAVVEIGSADNLYKVGMAAADGMERKPILATPELQAMLGDALALVGAELMGRVPAKKGEIKDGVDNQKA